MFSDSRIKTFKGDNIVEWLKYIRSKSGVVKQDKTSLDKASVECKARIDRRIYLGETLSKAPAQLKEVANRLENGILHIIVSFIQFL